jgi:RNA polymerase sigma-70 factor (ECF subfamily)
MNDHPRDGDALVEDYKGLVYHVIKRMVYDATAHDDLFQDTFISIFTSLGRFEGRSKFATWIYSIATNTCLNHLRQRMRVKHYSLEEWLASKSGNPSLLAQEADAVEPGTSDILERALQCLPPRLRMPISLYYIENMSYKEIAECLRIPIGTVKTNLYRGLRQMRAILGGDLNEFL